MDLVDEVMVCALLASCQTQGLLDMSCVQTACAGQMNACEADNGSGGNPVNPNPPNEGGGTGGSGDVTPDEPGGGTTGGNASPGDQAPIAIGGNAGPEKPVPWDPIMPAARNQDSGCTASGNRPAGSPLLPILLALSSMFLCTTLRRRLHLRHSR